MKKHAKHKYHKKKEFRFIPTNYVNKGGRIIKISHPAYIFLQKGEVYVYVTITHSNSVDNLTLFKLKKILTQTIKEMLIGLPKSIMKTLESLVKEKEIGR